MDQVTFTYPNSEKPALHNVSFSIPHQSTFAIVGPSGAGKSTLVDLLLGVISPQIGNIDLFGISPKKLIAKYHQTAYVPQNVYLISGSIFENIGLGLRPEEIDLDKCWEVLDRVHLSSWVLSLEKDLYSDVGERGSRLSGGQRQRIGIARALYQDPTLIVLDEATSALDAESEYEISQSIEAIKHRVTTIIIAHRLSTVKNCDSVAYLQGGELMAQGTFDQLRDLIPNFDRQANLMGITR
jgi:ABC-type multidrug transport system fused ATPase/permease subunit